MRLTLSYHTLTVYRSLSTVPCLLWALEIAHTITSKISLSDISSISYVCQHRNLSCSNCLAIVYPIKKAEDAVFPSTVKGTMELSATIKL